MCTVPASDETFYDQGALFTPTKSLPDSFVTCHRMTRRTLTVYPSIHHYLPKIANAALVCPTILYRLRKKNMSSFPSSHVKCFTCPFPQPSYDDCVFGNRRFVFPFPPAQNLIGERTSRYNTYTLLTIFAWVGWFFSLPQLSVFVHRKTKSE